MTPESDKWGWKHVNVFGMFHRGSGTKRWKCNHCEQCYNGSYSRVRAHLLGFNGLGVKPCPSIDFSTRESFKLLEKQLPPRRNIKKITRKLFFGPNYRSTSMRNQGVQDVDDVLARFCYADGVNVNVVDSRYFREMIRAIGDFGPRYELPSMEDLSGFLLRKEKEKLEKSLALAKESWLHTGCTILCVNRLDASLGCFCVNFFVASPRVVMFLKEVDIIGGDGPDNLFISELANVIEDVGSSNVLQVITRLGEQVSDVFESVILSKYPKIFWSHCTSHSILLLMEEIAELDEIKEVISSARVIEQCVPSFQRSSFCTNIDVPKGYTDHVSQKFAPSYSLVRRIFETREYLCQLVLREEWKQWRFSNDNPEVASINSEAVIASDNFWGRIESIIDVYEPFLRLLATYDVDKSMMGDVCNWLILSFEALRTKGIHEMMLNQLELLVESRWDKLFSPLHGAAYILNPKYFGHRHSKDKSLMRAWNTTLEKYEDKIEERRTLREELSKYWSLEACFGDADAVECRDKMEPISWWENFGYETPRLQTLAVKILSQIPSADIMCQESWQLCDRVSCREAVQTLGYGAEQAKDFVFVRNNFKLQNLRYRKVDC